MANVNKIKVNNNVYDIEDTTARSSAVTMSSRADGSVSLSSASTGTSVTVPSLTNFGDPGLLENDAVTEINDLKSQIIGFEGIPYTVKLALDNIIQNVAFKNDDVYTGDLATVHAWATAINLVSISAVFEQGGNVIYHTASLDDLKQYLTVTATYDNGTTATISNYTLSGALTVGTSTITVSFEDKTTTFSATITEKTNFTPASIVMGTFGATENGWTYDATSTKRAVINPIVITGLISGNTYKISLNGQTSVVYACGMYTMPNDADTYDWSVTEGTSKTITTDGYASYANIGHTAWTADDCTFTWAGDSKAVLAINFRNSGNTTFTSANMTTVKNNLSVTKVTA